jgi:hypothetical protein
VGGTALLTAIMKQSADAASAAAAIQQTEGFLAEYVREIDAQHKEPRAAWALLVSRLPAATIMDPRDLDTLVTWHRRNA